MPKILNEITSGYPLTKSDLYFGIRLVDLASARFKLILSFLTLIYRYLEHIYKWKIFKFYISIS